MKIIIAKNSAAVDYIIPHLVYDDDMDNESLGEQLKTAFRGGADNIFLALILDGDDLRAFVLAYDTKLPYAYLHQAWCDKGFVDQKWKDAVFLRLVLWAEARGMSEVRAETKRSPEAFLRRWDFKEHSKVLSYKIPDNFEEELIAGRKEYLKNKDEEKSVAKVPETPEEPPNEEITDIDKVVKGGGK